MLLKLAVIGFVGLCLAAADHIEKEIHLTVGKELTNEIQPPRFPSPGRQGTRQTWHLTADPGNSVQLICDELSIGPSEGCVNAFLEVDDGEQTIKYCGREPSLTIVSKDNKMTVVFELIRQSGIIQCGATAVKVQPPVEQHAEEGKINLHLGDAYDKLFYLNMKSNLKRSWQFTTDSDNKLGLTCYLLLANDTSCVTIDGEKRCGQFGNITKLSKGNSMEIEIVNVVSGMNGVDCHVQAVKGPAVEHFKNVVSSEVDSSEFGVGQGAKQTSCKCGWSNKKASRIINGKEASPGEFPWMVALKSEQGQFCGGSIISEYHVLTAAHCTYGRQMNEMTVLVGSVNNRNGEEYAIKLIREQRYQKLDLHRNDIAIITLDRPIKFTKDVGPVCLTQFSPDIDNKYVTIMGWGFLDTVTWERPNTLRKAQIRVVDQKTCSFQWFRKFGSEKDRMCTWSSNRDSCMGDSGSPVVWVDPETNRYTQIGLVSFGRGCNTDIPNVNTFVPHFYKWIQKEINLYPAGTRSCRKLG